MTSLPKDDVLTPEDELEQAFQEFDPDEEFDPEVPEQLAYGRTWQFDFAKGEMVKQGKDVVQLNGTENLRQWIELSMSVASGAHPIFPDEFGVDDPTLMIGSTDAPTLEAEFAEQVREALLYHDKIRAVTGFEFEYDENEAVVNYSFVVQTDDEDEESIEITSFGAAQ